MKKPLTSLGAKGIGPVMETSSELFVLRRQCPLLRSALEKSPLSFFGSLKGPSKFAVLPRWGIDLRIVASLGW